MIQVAICIIITILTRAGFYFFAGNEASIGNDANFQMKFIDSIRENNNKIPKRIEQFLNAGYIGYPFFIYWTLSFLDKKTVSKIRPFFGAIVDTFLVITIYIFSYYIFKTTDFYSNNSNLAFYSALFFATSPFLVRADGRAFSINGRAFGGLFYTLTMVFAILWERTGEAHWFFLSIFSGAIVFLSSRFGVQALIFINIILFFLTLKYIWIVIPVLSLLMAIVFSKGIYIRSLLAHINHLAFYYTTIQYKHFYVVALRYPLQSLRKAFYSKKMTNVWAELYRVPLIKVISHYPLLVICFFASTNNVYSLNILKLWIISGIIVFFIILIPKFSFIGEAERYLEFTVMPVSLLSSIWFGNLSNAGKISFMVPYMILSIILLCSNYWAAYNYGRGGKDKQTEKDVINYLKKVNKKLNILTIPTLFGKKIIRETRHNAVEYGGTLGSTKESRDEFEYLYPKYYDLPTNNLQELLRKYSLDIIIINHMWLNNNKFLNEYDFSALRKKFNNSEFTIYESKR